MNTTTIMPYTCDNEHHYYHALHLWQRTPLLSCPTPVTTNTTTIRPYTCDGYSRSGCRVAVKQCVVVALVDLLEGFEEGVSRCEHAVGQQESVEEINAQEAQICQAVQQPVHTGMPDLKHTNNQILPDCPHWYGRSVSLAGACLSRLTSVCCDKSMLAMTKRLLRQNYVCHDKIFLFHDKHLCLLRQTFCHDKHTFFTTKDVFCCDEHVFVATKVSLSWQKFCRDKTHNFVGIKL